MSRFSIKHNANIMRQRISDMIVKLTKRNMAGIEFGSYGIKYAAMNEFGGPMSDRQHRAMMAALRKRGKRREGKGVVTKRAGGWFWKPRPFLRPSIDSNRDFIVDEIMKGYKSGDFKLSFYRIGMLLKGSTQKTIREKRVIDRGSLMQSIRFYLKGLD